VVIGTVLFVVLGLAAVALKIFNDWLVKLEMPELITRSTHYLELFIFFVDVVSYGFFVIVEAYVLVREILAEAGQSRGSQK
jgi:hypothetical protein